MKHKKIEIANKTAIYGNNDYNWHVILLEPRIDFKSK